jgi:preprotein translocase SecE subunit
MARQTRQQRRARRAQSPPALAGVPPVPPPARPTSNGGEDPARRPARPEPEPRTDHPGFFRRTWHFIQESWGELNKVEWPNQHALVSGTAVVLIACLIVGFYLWLNDEVWKYVVQHVLL